MIEIQQIKAARALLNWTQTDLAVKSGISLPAIANIERYVSEPRQNTLTCLKEAFEKEGIVFMQPSGVQLIPEHFDVKVWEGHGSQVSLWNDIFCEFKFHENNELLIAHVSDTPLVDRYPEETAIYLKTLDEMSVQRCILLCEGDDNIIGNNPNWYRQIPKMLFTQMPHYIYGNKVALLVWSLKKVICINNKDIADAHRQQFRQNWKVAKPLKNFISIL